MAAPTPQMVPVGPETLIVIKVVVGNTNRRFKVPLKDLGAHILPHKVCRQPSKTIHRPHTTAIILHLPLSLSYLSTTPFAADGGLPELVPSQCA